MKIRTIPLLMLLLSAPALAATGTVLRNDKLYAQPSATATAAGSVSKGENVTVLAKQGGWLRVSAGRSTGWIRLLSVRVGEGGLGGAGIGDVVGAATTKSDPSRVVAVAGLRGLNDEELKQAKFNADELDRLDALATPAAQARNFAAQAGLAAANVPALPKPASPQQSSSPWEAN
ncbi:MAG: SH3 domain-containing protein [Thiobacillus sp.]|nr:SH3 domain-containing protein [Thiobacillus sp.]